MLSSPPSSPHHRCLLHFLSHHWCLTLGLSACCRHDPRGPTKLSHACSLSSPPSTPPSRPASRPPSLPRLTTADTALHLAVWLWLPFLACVLAAVGTDPHCRAFVMAVVAGDEDATTSDIATNRQGRLRPRTTWLRKEKKVNIGHVALMVLGGLGDDGNGRSSGGEEERRWSGATGGLLAAWRRGSSEGGGEAENPDCEISPAKQHEEEPTITRSGTLAQHRGITG